MTVTLFIPCFVDALFPRAGISMVEILERLGIPREEGVNGAETFDEDTTSIQQRLVASRPERMDGYAESASAPSDRIRTSERASKTLRRN